MPVAEWVSDPERATIRVGEDAYRPVAPFTIEHRDGLQAIVFEDVPTRITLADGTTEIVLSSWRLSSLDAAVAAGLLEPGEGEH